MNNSLVSHLRGYVEAMFKDMAFAYRSGSAMERDLNRLVHELENNGPRILTIDLPALCKHLDMCLSKGRYIPSYLPLGSIDRIMQVPIFQWDLYSQLFDFRGELVDNPPSEIIATLRQSLLGCKKILLPCQIRGKLDAIKDFIEVERDMLAPTLNWDGDGMLSLDPAFGSLRSQPWLLFERQEGVHTLGAELRSTLSAVADRISASFGDLHEDADFYPRHGPGVVAEQSRGASKFLFPDWPRKLDRVFPYDLYATTDLGWSNIARTGTGHELSYRNREVPSRLISVPKDLTKPRLIAAEPVQHQWIQQLLMRQLEDCVTNSVLGNCVRFRDQSFNQSRALEGSRTGGLTTIDLSSASDRLSCAVVERIFRCNTTLIDRLHACRTRWLQIDDEHFGRDALRLKKFGPMGSAVTFPIQSIVYAICAIACHLVTHRMAVNERSIREATKMVAVFGDDIVVETETGRLLTSCLTTLGLKVNAAKTYSEGFFRESCGIEAYKGVDVTPARVILPTCHASNGDIGSLIQTSNNFWLKGMWNVSEWINTTFAHFRKLIPVVGPTSRALGLVSFCGSKVSELKRRYNETYHRWEIKTLRLFTKTKVSPTEGPLKLFQWFIGRPTLEEVTFISDHSYDWWLRFESLGELGTLEVKVADARPGWVAEDTFDLPSDG